jgi:hypothetical protein
VPNAQGDVAIIQQRVTDNANLGTGSVHQIPLGGATVTVGNLTVRNANNEYTTRVSGGTFVFDNGASPAQFNELPDPVYIPVNNTGRIRLDLPVSILSDIIVNQNHNPGFNTSTEFVQLVSQAADKTFTKIGAGNLQFAYGGAVGALEGIQGNVFVNQGAIRLINGSGNTNTVFSKAAGVTVADGAQFQFGNGIESFSLAPGAEMKLNGLGKPSGAMPDGALRFEQQASFRRVVDFNSPIRLQTQSRIFVAAADVTAKLNEEIRGDNLAGLNKGGAGLLKLTTTSANGNTYAGQTNVSNGALAVNNTVANTSGVGTGDVFVNNGGLLGGTGTIGVAADHSNVSVSEGTLSPGDLSIDSTSGALIEHPGTLTVHGGVSFTEESFFNIDIGSTSDQLVASGAIDIGGSTLNLSLDAFIPDGVQSYTLISNTGAGSIADIFGTININGVAATSDDLDLNGVTYHLSYAAGVGGNDLLLLPGAATLGMPGDYNNDGAVDAADYVMWRKVLGTNDPLGGNGDETGGSAGVVDSADYTHWRENYGAGGAGAGGGAVPEPSAFLIVTLGLCGSAAARNRQRVAVRPFVV